MTEIVVNEQNLMIPETFSNLLNRMQFDFDASKKKLEEFLAPYRDLKLTEAQLSEAEVAKKELKALKDKIETVRTTVRDEWNSPYDDFVTKIKALLAQIDDAGKEFDNIIQKAKDDAKKEKKDKIMQFLTVANAPFQMHFVVEMSKIENPKWENKTYKLSDIETEIKDICKRIDEETTIIREQMGDSVVLYSTYKGSNYNMAEVYKKKAELDKALEEEKERLIKQEQEKIQQEAEKRAREEAEAKIKAEQEAQKASAPQFTPPSVEPVKEEPEYIVDYGLNGNSEEAEVKPNPNYKPVLKKFKPFSIHTVDKENKDCVIVSYEIEVSKQDFIDLNQYLKDCVDKFISERKLNKK